MLCSQGLAAPSFAVLGPKGVARLPPVCDAPFLSQGLAGAGRPAQLVSGWKASAHLDIFSIKMGLKLKMAAYAVSTEATALNSETSEHL